MAVPHLDLDGWLHLIEVLGGGAMGTKVVNLLVQSRDSLRDLKKDVGKPDNADGPPTGLFKTVGEHEQKINKHHEWLLVMRSKLGFKDA